MCFAKRGPVPIRVGVAVSVPPNLRASLIVRRCVR